MIKQGLPPPPSTGYQLSDNSVGVLFNDSTRLIMYEDGDSLQYIDRGGAESYLSVRSYPAALAKKVRGALQGCAVKGEESQ